MRTSSKKKILLLSPYFPYPPCDGGKVRVFNIIKQLSVHNDVYLLSFTDDPDNAAYIPDLKNYCKEVYTVPYDEQAALRSANVPDCVSFFYTQTMINALNETMEKVRPDIVQIDFLIMAHYGAHVKDIPVYYTEHDMSVTSFEHSIHDRHLPEKDRFVEWTKILRYEKEVLSRFTNIIVLTERDRILVRKLSEKAEPVIIPTGVDLEYFAFDPRISCARSKNLVYIGNYRHHPNYDAVVYFLREIFPHILHADKDVRLTLVGAGVSDEIRKMCGSEVLITGEVEDVREYLRQASVFVAPVRLGGGVKGKVLEAMAIGLPVVATGEVAEGLTAISGKDIAVAANAEDFAEQTLRLLNDPEMRKTMADNARKLVKRDYDWVAIGTRLDSLYENSIRDRSTRE